MWYRIIWWFIMVEGLMVIVGKFEWENWESKMKLLREFFGFIFLCLMKWYFWGVVLRILEGLFVSGVGECELESLIVQLERGFFCLFMHFFIFELFKKKQISFFLVFFFLVFREGVQFSFALDIKSYCYFTWVWNN